MKRERDNLMHYFRLVKTEYDNMIEQAEENEQYATSLNELSLKVDKINQSADKYLVEVSSNKQATSKVRMEKLPLPKFNGNAREYPRFLGRRSAVVKRVEHISIIVLVNI